MSERREASDASTFAELLSSRARLEPDRLALVAVRDAEDPGAGLTFAELDRKARSIAVALQRDTNVGDRALLIYPSGLAFIEAFFGCLYAGVIGVPIFPPRHPSGFSRVRSIIADAQPVAALSTDHMAREIAAKDERLVALSGLRWFATDLVPFDDMGEWEPPPIQGSTIAFLQYTSGSTSAPRGVMVSHENLLLQEAALSRAWGIDDTKTVVSWLPHYHDLGLIGMLLQAIYAGATCVFTSPLAFNQRPLLWLELISRFRAQISSGPNFAFELCVRKTTPEQRASLDLSSWDVAPCGAEPVRFKTLERFAQAFAPCGFRWEAFMPGYGLAEATLVVSSCELGAAPLILTADAAALEQNRIVPSMAGDESACTLVGCGPPLAGQEVAIINPNTLASSPDGEIGEIWVSGHHVAMGYWNRQEETRCIFKACSSDGSSTSWLRTGDLGFLSNGQLFITGRLKDLIIIDGRNLYPQDIEQTIDGCHPAIRAGCGAAFSIERDGEERLVVVQEVERHTRGSSAHAIITAIRQAVAEHHQVRVRDIRLIRAATIAKTTSGKIQRQACRTAFLQGTLQGIDGE